MEKKISFGFSKLSKKPNVVVKPQEEKQIELIDCLEGQSIKIKGAIEKVNEPLVIPIKGNKNSIIHQLKEKQKNKVTENKENGEDSKPISELTLDELAAKELINEAKNRLLQKDSSESRVFELPLRENESFEGEKEPTLDDYESIPISEYGMAMLRGMGWKEGRPIGKNTSKMAAVNIPELRPKGLGLGASKIVQSEMPKNKPVDKNGQELKIVKGAYAKVVAGTSKGNYCEVLGFDDEAGRAIIKLFPKGDVININELFLSPVNKEEFVKGSKVINNAKYEEYKEISEKKLKEQDDDRISNHRKEIYKQENVKIGSSDNSKYKEMISHKARDYDRSRTGKSIKKEMASDGSSSEYESKASKNGNNCKYESRGNRRRRDSSCSHSDSDEKQTVKSREKHRDSDSEREKKRKDKKSSYREKDKSRKHKSKSRHRRNNSSEDERRYRSRR